MREHALRSGCLVAVLVFAACQPATPADPSPPRAAFGVLAGGPVMGDALLRTLKDLGATWVRLNATIGGEPSTDVSLLLEANVNVVLTLDHRDATNVDTTYGSLKDWPQAGFPYRSRTTYQATLRTMLQPYARSLAQRRLYVQIENEVGDAAEASMGGSGFWRGTTDQYLALLDAAYEAIKTVDERAVVVLSGIAGGPLDAAVSTSERTHDYQVKRIGRLLAEGRYDAADLHFYQCAETIAQRAKFVTDRLPAGRTWISTENGGPDFRCATTPLHHDADPGRYEAIEAEQVPVRLRACADGGGAVCLWFSLMDLSGETEVFRDMGLIDNPYWPKPPARATPGRAPRQKPAYAAFRSFVASRP